MSLIGHILLKLSANSNETVKSISSRRLRHMIRQAGYHDSGQTSNTVPTCFFNRLGFAEKACKTISRNLAFYPAWGIDRFFGGGIVLSLAMFSATHRVRATG